MALPITERAEQLSKQIEVKSNIVFQIDGIDRIFGASEISEYIRIGDPDLFIGNDWVIGGVRLIGNQGNYISFQSGSSSRITQKLDPSRAQGSTITSMVISLIDKNNEITQMIAPGVAVTDVVNRDCVVSIGFKDGAYPRDYSVVFRGTIQQLEGGPGVVNFILGSAERKKVPPIFPKVQATLTAALDYRSVTIQDLFYQNREDVTNAVTVQYENSGVAGSENVIVTGTNIKVQMQSGVSTAKQIKKAIEDQASNQLVTVKIVGSDSNMQTATAVIPLGSGTSILLDDASAFTEPGDVMETFVRIEDEIIQFTDVVGNQLTGLTRGAFGSTPALHQADKDVNAIYKLTDNPLNLTLKIMLSQGETNFAEGVEIKNFNLLPEGGRIDDAIIFDRIDVRELYGVAEGDFATITGSSNPGNNVINAIINEIGLVNDGSYMILSTPFTDETDSDAVVSFKSQFNVLPVGMGMAPKEVDVQQHVFLRDTFLSTLTFGVVAQEEKNGKDWIEKELYLPAACFSVPRKGRSSVSYHIGPLARDKVVTLTANNVTNATQLKVLRSTSQNFANTTIFNYDFDPVTGDFLKQYVKTNDDAVTQLNDFEAVMEISSKGISTSLAAASIVAQSSSRLLGQYAFAAEYINGVKLLFGDGYTVEIGDVMAVDYESLQLTDFETGTRAGRVKLMEVRNKILDSKTGEVSVDLVNTVYSNDDRFGLISPASRTTTGSTTSKVMLRQSWSTKSFQRESLKWRNYLNQDIIICAPDYSIIYATKIISFDNGTPQGMLVSPALPAPPGDDWIVKCPNYPDASDPRVLEFWKNRHAFFSHQFHVASGASQTQFTLASAHTGVPYMGASIRVHTENYSQDSGDVKVLDVTGLVVTVNKPLGFIPNNTHLVDLNGFPDGQPSYRII